MKSYRTMTVLQHIVKNLPKWISNLSLLLLLLTSQMHHVSAKSKKQKNPPPAYADEIKPKHLEGQHFAMEPQDQTAVVGSRVTLPCRVMNKIGALQWTKDDFGLGQHRNLSGFERYSMIGSDEEGDFSLDVYPVMLDDDAKYQCQVGPGPHGEPGIRSKFAKLSVLVPPEAPQILQGEYLVTTEDRDIELECVSMGGKPAAEITWIDGFGNVLTKDIDYIKEPLPDSRRVTAKSILKLAPKKEHHNTTFTCQAQNAADRTYRSAKILLEVKYAPKVSVAIIGGIGESGRIMEGSEVEMSCDADANPHELNYRWYVNDELIPGDYTTKMVIHNITRQYHDAIVKCEVVNAVGKSEESETLDVSYGPAFRSRPVSVQADMGTTAKMKCEVDGNPAPEIEWIHENSEKVVGTSSSLTVTVSTENSGRYYCKATVPGFPEIGTEATVYVKRAPIITSHKVQFGAVGNRAKIDCLAFSIPKADQILWSYDGKLINMSTADPDTYIFEEHHLPEGVRAALIIKESQTDHYGKYNCTIINSYGSDSLLITLIPEPNSVPVLLVVMGSMSSVAIILMVVMIIIVYLKRSKKKPMQTNVLPDAAQGVDKLTDFKNELRSKAFDAAYSEGSSDGLAINLTQAPLPDVQLKSATLGVPLAGPVKLDERFPDDFCGEKTIRPSIIKSIKNNTTNGYTPFFEYALDYSPPNDNKANISSNANKTKTYSTMNSATLPYSTTSLAATNNTSLPRNCGEMQSSRQQANVNGFMGQSLLQNGIDSRFSAIYGNPYLRTNSSMLPPLPPPATANPAATPAPPPYHPPRHHVNSTNIIANSIKNLNTTNTILGNNIPGSASGSSSNLTSSSNTLAVTPLAQPSGSSTLLTNSSSKTGQFILSANGTAKKGALATHV